LIELEDWLRKLDHIICMMSGRKETFGLCKEYAAFARGLCFPPWAGMV
jgi:hypothetical protein